MTYDTDTLTRNKGWKPRQQRLRKFLSGNLMSEHIKLKGISYEWPQIPMKISLPTGRV